MIKIADIMEQYAQAGVNLLKESIAPYRATGKTESSIRYEVEENPLYTRMTIYGRKFFKTIETGRGKRKGTEYGGFDESLDEYMRAKGFPSKTSKSGNVYYRIGDQWFTGKSLAYMINKRGDSVYRSGGRKVYSEALEKLMQEMKEKIKERILSL